MSEARILLVEDSLGIARALSRALMLSPGGTYRVTTCTSGEEALEKLQADTYDLLITDLRLPGMDGLNLLAWARENYPDTRSVLITAYGSPQVEERARRLVNAYLPKPFRLHDLIQIVHSILEAPAAPPPSLLEHETRPTEEAVIAMPERESITHLIVLATDFDGTLAMNGHVTSETWEMLRQAKNCRIICDPRHRQDAGKFHYRRTIQRIVRGSSGRERRHRLFSPSRHRYISIWPVNPGCTATPGWIGDSPRAGDGDRCHHCTSR